MQSFLKKTHIKKSVLKTKTSFPGDMRIGKESEELNALLRSIRDQNDVGILLIEHDMSVVMTISDHVIVLDHGSLIADDDPAGVRCDPAVIRAYLGTDDA